MKFYLFLFLVVSGLCYIAPDISGGEMAPSLGEAQMNPCIVRWGTAKRDGKGIMVEGWWIDGRFPCGRGYEFGTPEMRVIIGGKGMALFSFEGPQ